jgi:hypothetical protein
MNFKVLDDGIQADFFLMFCSVLQHSETSSHAIRTRRCKTQRFLESSYLAGHLKTKKGGGARRKTEAGRHQVQIA